MRWGRGASPVKKELRFWGVRGSMPAPGPHTVRVGGNTTCVSLQCGEHLLVLDAGTGICRMDAFLEDKPIPGVKKHLFLSHYHWDHIWGLPFHCLAQDSADVLEVFGEDKDGLNVEQILARQMEAPIFPVPLESMGDKICFRTVRPHRSIAIAPDVAVSTCAMQHPQNAIGYRVDMPGSSVCVITDHEHPDDDVSESIVAFARGATVMVHDAQYSPEEKKGPKAGWGHSSWLEAALAAKAAGVDRLYLSHHDPGRSDDELQDILQRARRIFPATELATETTLLEL